MEGAEPILLDEPAASEQAGEPSPFSSHYQRLQAIEQRVVRAIEAAGFVMGELAKPREEVDKHLLHAAASGFVQQIQEAQQLVLAAVRAAAPERAFEANNYFLMLQSMVAAEKLDACSLHLSGLSKLLKQQGQVPPQQANGQAGAAAGEGGGLDGMLVDGAG